jgi:putative Holliday junction resolvase
MGSDVARTIALDIGTERVGVAISDPLGITAQPGPTLSRNPDEVFFGSLAELLREWDVAEVVVGLPRGLKGQEGESARRALELVGEFQRRWPAIRWSTWDERFTTRAADLALISAPKKTRRRKGLRDQIAAQLILEGYLRFRQTQGGSSVGQRND